MNKKHCGEIVDLCEDKFKRLKIQEFFNVKLTYGSAA